MSLSLENGINGWLPANWLSNIVSFKIIPDLLDLESGSYVDLRYGVK